jgi:hypothetical protein
LFCLLSDIITILNRTWPTTLGNQSFARKTLLERGWTVLNYVLLDNPCLQTLVADQPNNQETATINPSVLDTLNINNDGFCNHLDKLLDERNKLEGRKYKYEEQQSNTKTHQERLDELKKTTGLSLGKLAGNNCYCITKESIQDRMIEEESAKQKKNEEAKL